MKGNMRNLKAWGRSGPPINKLSDTRRLDGKKSASTQGPRNAFKKKITVDGDTLGWVAGEEGKSTRGRRISGAILKTQQTESPRRKGVKACKGALLVKENKKKAGGKQSG